MTEPVAVAVSALAFFSVPPSLARPSISVGRAAPRATVRKCAVSTTAVEVQMAASA